jgi:hypothetical protein
MQNCGGTSDKSLFSACREGTVGGMNNSNTDANFSSPESVILTHTTYLFGEREGLTSLEGEWNSIMLHFRLLSSCIWGMFGSVGLQSFTDVSGR